MAEVDHINNPCSLLGCNSNKCEWASGGRISRLDAKKSCKNALDVRVNGTAISTLKECMNLVRAKKGVDCEPNFQMHKDTFACACVPRRVLTASLISRCTRTLLLAHV